MRHEAGGTLTQLKSNDLIPTQTSSSKKHSLTLVPTMGAHRKERLSSGNRTAAARKETKYTWMHDTVRNASENNLLMTPDLLIQSARARPEKGLPCVSLSNTRGTTKKRRTPSENFNCLLFGGEQTLCPKVRGKQFELFVDKPEKHALQQQARTGGQLKVSQVQSIIHQALDIYSSNCLKYAMGPRSSGLAFSLTSAASASASALACEKRLGRLVLLETTLFRVRTGDS